METLLAHSFDYLSSYDLSKIRKGLRQVEGLMAQICLSSDMRGSERNRARSSARPAEAKPAKALGELKEDPAFLEFFKLQDSFQWNVTMRLVACLERLLALEDAAADSIIIQCLNLVQGSLLLHPASRRLFARESYINVLLDLLDPDMGPAIQSATVLTLVTALLGNPANTRTFEELDGLLTVTSLFKSRYTSKEVKLKIVEFLYFYLMPEANGAFSGAGSDRSNGSGGSKGSGGSGGARRVGADRKVSSWGRAYSALSGCDGEHMKTTQEKQGLLGQYIDHVEDLVDDLKETVPFDTEA